MKNNNDPELQNKVNRWYQVASNEEKERMYKEQKKYLLMMTIIPGVIGLALSIYGFVAGYTAGGAAFLIATVVWIGIFLTMMFNKEKAIKQYITRQIKQGQSPLKNIDENGVVLNTEGQYYFVDKQDVKFDNAIKKCFYENYGDFVGIAYDMILLQLTLNEHWNDICETIRFGYKFAKDLPIYQMNEEKEKFKNEYRKLYSDKLFQETQASDDYINAVVDNRLDFIRIIPQMLAMVPPTNTNLDRALENFKEEVIEDKSLLKSIFNEVWWNYFIFSNELKEIDENDDLKKILKNAINKYGEIDVVADKTYQIYLDERRLSQDDLSSNMYLGLINMFYINTMLNRIPELDELVENNPEISIEECLTNVSDTESETTLKLLVANKLKYFKSLDTLVNEISKHFKRIKDSKKEKIKKDLIENNYTKATITINDVDLMSGIEFENFIADLFNKMGYKTQVTKASGDQGIDVIAEKDDYKIAVQAKCYQGVVGNHAIMEAVGGMKFYNANKCMVITNSTFTKSAIDLADINDVELWDRAMLEQKMREVLGRKSLKIESKQLTPKKQNKYLVKTLCTNKKLLIKSLIPAIDYMKLEGVSTQQINQLIIDAFDEYKHLKLDVTNYTEHMRKTFEQLVTQLSEITGVELEIEDMTEAMTNSANEFAHFLLIKTEAKDEFNDVEQSYKSMIAEAEKCIPEVKYLYFKYVFVKYFVFLRDVNKLIETKGFFDKINQDGQNSKTVSANTYKEYLQIMEYDEDEVDVRTYQQLLNFMIVAYKDSAVYKIEPQDEDIITMATDKIVAEIQTDRYKEYDKQKLLRTFLLEKISPDLSLEDYLNEVSKIDEILKKYKSKLK